MGDHSPRDFLAMFLDYFWTFRNRRRSLFSIRGGKATDPNMLSIRSIFSVLTHLSSSQIPLTDECPSIHVFCAKLEYLLLFGLKPVGGIFNKKPAVEYFSFLRQVTKQSKQLIDGLRYINLKKSLQTDLGRGRGLLRYYLSQNCLADLLQTIIT